MTFEKCPRCNEKHEELQERELSQPIKTENRIILFTHWIMCPTKKEPILVTMKRTEFEAHFRG